MEQSELKQGEFWRSTHKAVHTLEGAHTRRCTHKAHVLTTEQRVQPKQKAKLMRIPIVDSDIEHQLVAHGSSSSSSSSNSSSSSSSIDNSSERPCSADLDNPRQLSVATAGVLLSKGAAGAGRCVERSKVSIEPSEPKQREVWRSTHEALHTQGSAHKVVYGHRRSLVI